MTPAETRGGTIHLPVAAGGGPGRPATDLDRVLRAAEEVAGLVEVRAASWVVALDSEDGGRPPGPASLDEVAATLADARALVAAFTRQLGERAALAGGVPVLPPSAEPAPDGPADDRSDVAPAAAPAEEPARPATTERRPPEGRWRRLLRYPARQWRALVVIVLASLAFSLTAALQPLPLKLLVDNAVGGQPTPPVVASVLDAVGAADTPSAVAVVAALAMLVLLLVDSALSVVLSWSWTAAGQRMVYDLAGDLFIKLQRLSLLFHARRDVGDSLSRLSGDTYAVYTLTEALLVAPLQHLVTFAIVGMAAWSLDPQLAALTLLAAPGLAVVTRTLGRRVKLTAKESTQAKARLTAMVHQTVTAMPAVQAFDGVDRETARLRLVADEAVVAARRAAVATTALNQATLVVAAAGAAVVTYAGARRVVDGSLSLGALLVFFVYLRTLQRAASALMTSYAGMRAGAASVDRVLEVMDADEEVPEPAHPVTLAHRPRGHVRLEAVGFGYEQGRPVLEHVDLDAAPGETVALVGQTGAGKSTIAALIPRLFDPWTGRVTLDGTDIRNLPIAGLRASVAVVLQEPFLMPLSIRDNIAYGRPGASLADVESAARAAQIHEFVRTLPDGYDTVIGERGATLSGGERQRVAIARALLKDTSVLVLDEPTASLDVLTEHSLMEALGQLMAGRTTFVIAHRLSTIRQADRIAVVEGGRVVEVGRHDDLVRAGGRYAALYGASVHEPPAVVL